MHLSYPGPESCAFSSWVSSGCSVGADYSCCSLDGGLPVSILSPLKVHHWEGPSVMAWWLQHPPFTDRAGNIFHSQSVCRDITIYKYNQNTKRWQISTFGNWVASVENTLEQQSPAFLTPGTSFMEDNFSMGGSGGGDEGLEMVWGWFKCITFIVHFISIIITSASPQIIRH